MNYREITLARDVVPWEIPLLILWLLVALENRESPVAVSLFPSSPVVYKAGHIHNPRSADRSEHNNDIHENAKHFSAIQFLLPADLFQFLSGMPWSVLVMILF